MKLKVCVAGGRDFNNYEVLSQKLDAFLAGTDLGNVCIVSGCSAGADALGERYARENELALLQIPPRWAEDGDKAWEIMNEKMAKFTDVIIAFWDGQSLGTADMIYRGRTYSRMHLIFDYDGNEIRDFSKLVKERVESYYHN